LTYFVKSTELDPQYAEPHRNAARCLAKLGRQEEANKESAIAARLPMRR